MTKFALEKIELVKGKQIFYDLIIDGAGQFSSFSKEVETAYKSELLTIIARMDLVSNLQRLPKEKFRNITPKKESVKEYEFKTKHLRVYAIHLENTGKVILLAGYKNSQKRDIPSFRNLKNQFLKSLEDDK